MPGSCPPHTIQAQEGPIDPNGYAILRNFLLDVSSYATWAKKKGQQHMVVALD